MAGTRWGSVHNASVIRHIAILVAALTAYVMRVELMAGNELLWVLGIAAVLNLATFSLRGHPIGPLLGRLSPWLGITCWTLLAFFTGGISSPFIAGLGLEIVLSAMGSSPREAILVTSGSVVSLCGQQMLLGAQGHLVPMAIWSFLLLGMGGVTSLLTWSWTRDRDSARAQRDELRDRLRSLEKRLSESEILCEVGESTARLAHGLKNTVHSLRGFTELIEPELRSRRGSRRAFEGLNAAIDGLEKLARSTLDGGGARPDHEPGDARVAIEEATEEVSVNHPSIQCVRRFSDRTSRVSAPTAVVREVLLVIIRNAVEAMRGHGEVILETFTTEMDFLLFIRDHGNGFGEEGGGILTGPVSSTKPGGSGYGLFLARRLLEKHGGRLTASAAAGGGAELSITLPLHRE